MGFKPNTTTRKESGYAVGDEYKGDGAGVVIKVDKPLQDETKITICRETKAGSVETCGGCERAFNCPVSPLSKQD